MVIFQKEVVDTVQNKDGVFEQVEPDFGISFDFNKPIAEQPVIHSPRIIGIAGSHYAPRKNFAKGGVVKTHFVKPNDIGLKIDKSWIDEGEIALPKR